MERARARGRGRCAGPDADELDRVCPSDDELRRLVNRRDIGWRRDECQRRLEEVGSGRIDWSVDEREQSLGLCVVQLNALLWHGKGSAG